MNLAARVAFLHAGRGPIAIRTLLRDVALAHERRLGARITDPHQALASGASPFTLCFSPLVGGRFDSNAEYAVEFSETADPAALSLDMDALVLAAADATESDLTHQMAVIRSRQGRALQPAGLPVFVVNDAGATNSFAPARFGSLAVHPTSAANAEQFAELVREALAAARRYHRRRERAAARLGRAFQIVIGVTLGFALFAVAMVGLRHDWFFPQVTRRVAEYRQFEGPPPLHLQPLDRRTEVLTELASDPEFNRLSPSDRGYVESRLDELRRYREWCDRLLSVRPPDEARDREELYAIDATLEALGHFPNEWRDSAGAGYWARLCSSAKTLRTATKAVTDWYDADRQAAERLLYFADWPGVKNPPWLEWRPRVKSFLTHQPSFASEPFAAVLTYPEVTGTIERWRGVRTKLHALAEIVDAVGLTGGPVTPRSDTANWRFADLPDAAMIDVAAAAARAYQSALADGRTALAAVHQQIPGPDSRDRWQAALTQFRGLPKAVAWASWVAALQRLMGGTPVDPIAELDEFLRRESFPLTPREGRRWPDLWPGSK